MDIEDVDILVGIDVGKAEHWATALTRAGRKVLERALSVECVVFLGQGEFFFL